MTAIAKNLIPNREWLVKIDEQKVGTITKKKKEFLFLKNGRSLKFGSIADIKQTLDLEFDDSVANPSNASSELTVHGFPCSGKPFDPVFNIKKRLPLYTKNAKSKCRFCAGYYLVKSKNHWVSHFCPKLIVLERADYVGPFKSEVEAHQYLNYTLHNETT